MKGVNVLIFLSAFYLYGQVPLKISELAPNIFIYTTYHDVNGQRFPSNSMYIVTDEGVVLIDTPWDQTQFQPLLDSIEKKHKKLPVLAIVTHFHDDRTAGLDYFKSKGIKTYSSEKTFTYCKEKKEPQADYIFFRDTTFHISTMELETFYPGEGHSPDNIVIYLKNEKVLFGGCFVKSLENNSIGNIADANLDEWPSSMRRVMEKYPEVKIVVPGHFSWSDGKSLKHTLKLIKKAKK